MDDRLFELLDDLNAAETKLLLYKDINLKVDSSTRKHIENSIKRKTGYYNKDITIIEKISDILGGFFMKRKIALALGAFMILGSSGGAYAYTYAKAPIAYVSMDINPSVELGVNAFDKVVSVEAYNADGEKILEGTNLINSNVSDAVSTVISNAISDGYITEDVTTTTAAAVEITTSTDKEDVATELNESLKEVAETILDNNNLDVEVETENVALARRDEARKLGITPGKLNLIQKLQELDPTVVVEDYKDSSVKEIQKKTKELRKENKVDETTTDSGITSDEVTEENNNSSDNKHNNGNGKKEEITNTEKQNNSNNANSQGNNSLKSENSNNSKSENNSSNSNSSKSENSGNGNSNSQNKDKNKNN